MKQLLLILFFATIGLMSSASALNLPMSNASIVRTGDPIEVKVYPNPTSHYFEINSSEELSRIEVFNLLGRKITTFDYEPTKLYDISELPKGMYLIQLFDNEKQILTTRRLQKR